MLYVTRLFGSDHPVEKQHVPQKPSFAANAATDMFNKTTPLKQQGQSFEPTSVKKGSKPDFTFRKEVCS